MSFTAETVGRLAREALAAGEGEVCAVFRRSFYVKCAHGHACVGDRALGRGPLNALVPVLAIPALGERISVSLAGALLWTPPPIRLQAAPSLPALRLEASRRLPKEGLGGLIVGEHNALSTHAQPALEALDRWLVGNALGDEVEGLLGLGPGLTPSGDDYLGGMLIALRACSRAVQADALWRRLSPQLAARTSAISAAHLAAAAAGEGHEALHDCLGNLCQEAPDWEGALARLDAVGHCSGWDALAGVVAVLRAA